MSSAESLDRYADAVEQFCRERDWEQYHTAKDLAIGLVTESAELLELFRFLDEQDALEALDEKAFRQRVADELGDALFFLVRFAQRFDFDLVEAARGKLAKSEEKYPAGEYAGVNRKVLD